MIRRELHEKDLERFRRILFLKYYYKVNIISNYPLAYNNLVCYYFQYSY